MRLKSHFYELEVTQMATQKQKEAAKENIKKAQEAWQEMTMEERAESQPEGHRRETPGKPGGGEYYHIEVRPKEDFVTFRTQDVGEKGGIERVGGQRENGSWDTVKWLISKDFAHVKNGKLVADHPDAKKLFDELGTQPRHIEGDRFEAKDRPNVAEKDKPTEKQQRARRENIKKAQEARTH